MASLTAPPAVATMLAAVARHRAPLAAALCGLVFFLGAADRVFAIRIDGVNVRFANLLLGVGVLAWLAVRRARAWTDVAALAVAWLPFLAVYGIAALRAPDTAASLLKLGWFAFGFVGAFVWCRLFDTRDVVCGFFGAFTLVSAIIVVDFATGFMHGERFMIGYGQPNDLASGEILWRPHAFYYEPSYAASGIALAWALAMTSMGRAAAVSAASLVVVGTMALTVVMSRTGWLYALVVLLALAIQRIGEAAHRRRIRWPAVLLAAAGGALVVSAVFLSDETAPRFGRLAGALGLQSTFERVCPLVRHGARWLALSCEDSDEALRSVGVAAAEESSEGQRIVDAGHALSRIAQRPLLGHGVARGNARLLEPTAKNTWLEIAVEGGLLSAAAFAWGLVLTLRRHGAFGTGGGLVGWILVLWFAVAWQFIQTFPRLDPWLAFWAALAFTSRSRDVKA